MNAVSSVWSDLRRLEPVSRAFGFDRGTPVDRYYIERFLEQNAVSVRGRVLEIGDATYTRRFGGERVTHSDVLHAEAGNRPATLMGDLASGTVIPRDVFDCIILTQVLPFVFDVRGALATCHAALKAGGVLLATVPGISQISRYDMDRWGDFWRFTSLSLRRLAGDAFDERDVQIRAFGNVLVATAFLQGIPVQELTIDELEYIDPDYELLITLKAVRRSA